VAFRAFKGDNETKSVDNNAIPRRERSVRIIYFRHDLFSLLDFANAEILVEISRSITGTLIFPMGINMFFFFFFSFLHA